jgi:hypothetical protein
MKGKEEKNYLSRILYHPGIAGPESLVAPAEGEVFLVLAVVLLVLEAVLAVSLEALVLAAVLLAVLVLALVGLLEAVVCLARVLAVFAGVQPQWVEWKVLVQRVLKSPQALLAVPQAFLYVN